MNTILPHRAVDPYQTVRPYTMRIIIFNPHDSMNMVWHHDKFFRVKADLFADVYGCEPFLPYDFAFATQYHLTIDNFPK